MAVLNGGARYLVIGAPELVAGICAGLGEAKVPCESVEPESVTRIVPAGPCGLNGWQVGLPDATRSFAGVVVASPPAELSWLDPALLDWEGGRPALVAGMLAPGLANLYLLGAGTACFRGGGVELLVAMINAQAEFEHPIVDELLHVTSPSHRSPAGRAGRRLERRLQRRLRLGGSAGWWAAAQDADGPLAGARSA
jgi:hypothetical protein